MCFFDEIANISNCILILGGDDVIVKNIKLLKAIRSSKNDINIIALVDIVGRLTYSYYYKLGITCCIHKVNSIECLSITVDAVLKGYQCFPRTMQVAIDYSIRDFDFSQSEYVLLRGLAGGLDSMIKMRLMRKLKIKNTHALSLAARELIHYI